MKNLDAVINQWSNEHLRTEVLLMKDVEKVKNACRLFFDKQAREADAFISMLSTTVDDIIVRVRDGYPSHKPPMIRKTTKSLPWFRAVR